MSPQTPQPDFVPPDVPGQPSYTSAQPSPAPTWPPQGGYGDGFLPTPPRRRTKVPLAVSVVLLAVALIVAGCALLVRHIDEQALALPGGLPTNLPTGLPSGLPTAWPSGWPTTLPITLPTGATAPTTAPAANPTTAPSSSSSSSASNAWPWWPFPASGTISANLSPFCIAYWANVGSVNALQSSLPQTVTDDNYQDAQGPATLMAPLVRMWQNFNPPDDVSAELSTMVSAVQELAKSPSDDRATMQTQLDAWFAAYPAFKTKADNDC